MATDNLLDLMKAPPASARKSQGLEPEFAAPFQAWKQSPTPQTASALVSAVKPVIDTALKPLGDSPALRGRAKQIVLTAASTYDPSQAGLRTHLMTHLQGLKRIAAQQEMPIHVPERVMLQQRSVQQATAELADELGREPADSELADRTGLSPRRLAALRTWHRPMSESAASWESPEGEVSSPAVQDGGPQEVLENFVYSDLEPRDQLILDYSLGRHGRPRLSGRDIASQVGISPAAVSQRLAGIQQRFNAAQDLELFGS
jgi:DNA-directed RNA polymerase specialized sigma subunit